MRPAEIPIFDLNGPNFLAFYAVMLGCSTAWAFVRAYKVTKRYDRAGYYPELTDPYEVAYLAGGAPRAVQLAVVRLMAEGSIRNQTGFSGNRLLFQKPPEIELNGIERRILSEIERQGKAGLPVTAAFRAVITEMRAPEVRLASLGLRPTQEEHLKAGWSAAIPVLVVMAVGLIKLLIGVARDKPVGFLIVLLVLSLILACIVAASPPKLTRTGAELLEKLRAEKTPPPQSGSCDGICWSFALAGPAILAGMPAFAGIYTDMKSHTGFSADGGSTGCGGSSGCGGGGCGGCGGD